MKKIILILGGALLLLVLYKTVGSSLPEYNPERSYVNLETEIIEAFILAKDSATIEDAAGDNLKISESKNVTIRNVRTAWTGTISTQNGAYGIYPVLT